MIENTESWDPQHDESNDGFPHHAPWYFCACGPGFKHRNSDECVAAIRNTNVFGSQRPSARRRVVDAAVIGFLAGFCTGMLVHVALWALKGFRVVRG